MEEKIKEPEAITTKKGISIESFVTNKVWDPEDEQAIKNIFQEWSNLVKILRKIKTIMKGYNNNQQEELYDCSDKLENALNRICKISYSLDSIEIPRDLEIMINHHIETTFDDSSKEDIITKESILKQFHEDLYQRLLFSSQLSRSLNKSIKTLEDQVKDKVLKLLKEKEYQ